MRNILTMSKTKIIAELQFILNDGKESYLKTIQQVNEFFVSLMKPKNLDGGSSDNVLIQYEAQYLELAAGLKMKGINNPDELTVSEFYATLKYLETKTKQEKNEGNRRS